MLAKALMCPKKGDYHKSIPKTKNKIKSTHTWNTDTDFRVGNSLQISLFFYFFLSDIKLCCCKTFSKHRFCFVYTMMYPDMSLHFQSILILSFSTVKIRNTFSESRWRLENKKNNRLRTFLKTKQKSLEKIFIYIGNFYFSF